MKTLEEVIQVLGGLSDRDRAWIIERLSPQLRGALMSGAATAPGASAKNVAVVNASDRPAVQRTSQSTLSSEARPSSSGSEIVAMAEAVQIIAALKNEPTWVLHAVLSRPWSWCDEIRNLVSPVQKSELLSLNNAGVVYASKLVDLIIDHVAAAVPSVVVAHKPSKFESLVASFGVKLAQKGMSIRA